jgi:uncharacterized membrane protein YhaH (DUF805 family)
MVASAHPSSLHPQHRAHFDRRGSGQRGGGVLGGLFGLAVLIPCILVHIKRWHDRDKSGWWMLILFVPIIGAIWFLIELGFLPGTPGPNRFGQPPTD